MLISIWLKNHPCSLRVGMNPTCFSLLVGCNYTGFARLKLVGANLYPSSAFQILQHRKACQKSCEKALSFSILHVAGILVLCVQFLTWQALRRKVDRYYILST